MRQGQQRYLLQLAYTDRALGVALRRLRETGVYDRALVIVTADHGVGFRAGDHRRLPTPGNLDEIAFVPLLVKLPGQRTGRIDDAAARNVDVLPTVARVLGLPLRWRTDGRPLVGRRPSGNATVTVLKQDGSRVSAPQSRLLAQRERALETQIATFGSGSLERVFRIGPHRELVGRAVASLPVVAARGTSVELDGRVLLDSVDRAAGFVPTFVEGRVQPTGTRADLAVALNGRVAAVTRTFDQHGQTRFSAMVAEDALRNGRNDVEVFAVEVAGGEPRLVRLRGSDLRFSLVGGGAAIRVGARTVPVRAGSLRGVVRARRGETGWTFSGFAAEARTNRRVDTIVVFAGERAAYSGRAENLKPHAILGQPELGRTGFEFELPRSLLPAPGAGRVRVYALRDGTAAQLRPAAGFPWR
jgi:hypothetical protein